MRTSIGHYRVERILGQGGMGTVYAAYDEQLGRAVAIKTIREDQADPASRERLRREARAAAAVTHPNVCHVYEVGEDGDTIYIVMELLTGEPLSDRIERGTLPVQEAIPVALGMLAAIEALHARGIVHRDLKPGNVFLTPHGVKLLDFGLARGLGADAAYEDLRVTATGIVVGTPRYMAPEQLEGAEPGPASDLFAFGALLFEMLSGRPAFDGKTIWEVSHAVLHEQPPALTGGAGTAALDTVIRRCLVKRPEDRCQDPAAVASDLRSAAALYDTAETLPVQATTRLMVLPFRLLRPDPDIDFLSFGLADALIASLTGLGPLVVRSSHAAQRYADESPDLQRIATEGQVDVVLTGTLLRSGEKLRLVAQLVEVPGGTVLWSKTAQVDMGDVFQVQDDLARQVVDSLALPLTGRERGLLDRDVPASGHVYELYLRANHLAHGATLEPARLMAARELYTACLEEDPQYAPAWAQIGRVYRVLAKWAERRDEASIQRAREAFERAFALNPQLPLAHHLYTHFEIEELGRAETAMIRLLSRVRDMPTDADLYAGLVVACRYCGLLQASLTADARAQQLDPNVRTSVDQTWLLLGDKDNPRRFADREDPGPLMITLLQENRLSEARRILADRLPSVAQMGGVEHAFIRAVVAVLDGRASEVKTEVDRIRRSGFRDPEGLLYGTLLLAQAGEHEDALSLLEEVVEGGLVCTEMQAMPWMAPLRGLERFEEIMRRATAARDRAAQAFRAADGHRLLGMTEG